MIDSGVRYLYVVEEKSCGIFWMDVVNSPLIANKVLKDIQIFTPVCYKNVASSVSNYYSMPQRQAIFLVNVVLLSSVMLPVLLVLIVTIIKLQSHQEDTEIHGFLRA